MAELVRAEKELSEWFPERSQFSYTEPKMDRSRKGLTKSCFEKKLRIENSFVWSRNLVIAFLPIIFAKTCAKTTLWKSFVPLFRFCSARLLIEIRFADFAVRKFVKSHNNKSFIELACSVRIGKILASFQVLFSEVRQGP